MGTFGADGNGEATSGMNHKGESTDAGQGAEHSVVATKSVKADGAKGVCVVRRHRLGQPARGGA
jgi:hypothetical protein